MLVALPLHAQLTGYIIDDQTGDSIPYASAIYRGHGVAVASNINGHFRIARHNGWVLTFSAIGYVSKSITIDAKTKNTFNVKLKPDTKTLKEVTIKSKKTRYSRKNNPAVELMKKVIAAKKQTDLDNRDYYQYNKYQKITLALNDITPERLQEDKFKNKKWLADQVEKCEYTNKLILPVSVDETVTQKIYRKSPHSEKNIVKGQNSSGVNDLFQTGDILTTTLKDVFTDVNIYDDQVRLLQYPFTSPIGKDAIGFYRYYIMDTVYVDRDKCFHLHFMPNNQQDFGFRGDIYILADSSYQVKRCELTIPKRSDVNFVENLEVRQEFKMLPDSTWVLSEDDMIAEIKLASWIQRCIVIRNTRLTDYAFDELPKQLFKGKAKDVKEADAMMRDEAFWNKYRQVSLTKSESKMDAFVHNLEQIKGFKYIIFGLKAFIENFVETGNPSKVDIGPINTMLTSNTVDGLRTRVSAQTTAKLNPNWFASGYFARGWDSKKNYYKADLIYSFNKKEYLPREFPKRTLTLSSTYDIMAPSDKFMKTDKDNVFTSFKWSTVDKMMFYNRQQITFEREEDWGFKTTIGFKAEENEGALGLDFTPLRDYNAAASAPAAAAAPAAAPAASAPALQPQCSGCQPAVSPYKFRTSEFHVELRYAPGETFINTKQRRLKINLDAPVFSVGHTLGVKGFLGGDYTYNFTEASIYKRFWMNSWGKIDCYLKGGIQWNQVPYPLLIMPETNLSYIIQDETFELIDNMEFLNDRFASLYISWDFNGKIFNRIPLLKKLKWREYVAFRCLWGSLSDKNNPFLEQNALSDILMMFPTGCRVMDSKTPYYELSLGIHNIFKLIHVEYVRRLNYNDYPGVHKDGIRLMVRMTF
ncbi:MAG: DUF5686 family protein [Prevotellaceae bacterium]|nr:DUF5686 family protein [Prevotellaceae bacterium]